MTPSTTNTAAQEAVEDHANRMCDVLAAYDQAVSDLSGAYECGWNADDCRPRLHRHVDRLRRLVLHHMQALRTKQPAASEGDGRAMLRECYEWLFESKADGPQVSEGAIERGYYTPEFRDLHDRLRAAIDNTSKQAAGEAVDSTFAEWLASEMPAGTVIGDPTWWANRIARQYQVHCTPRHPADEGVVGDSMVERAADAYEAAAESEGFGRVEGSERVTHLRFIRAAIDAALQAGTP